MTREFTYPGAMTQLLGGERMTNPGLLGYVALDESSIGTPLKEYDADGKLVGPYMPAICSVRASDWTVWQEEDPEPEESGPLLLHEAVAALNCENEAWCGGVRMQVRRDGTLIKTLPNNPSGLLLNAAEFTRREWFIRSRP